jgi:hypothetical protein
MNLKESFRYQKFLDSLMNSACAYLRNPDHYMQTTEKHMRSKRNPDAVDEEKVIQKECPFQISDVVAFMQWLISEKEELTTKIGRAKAFLANDMDAMVESNKYRQRVSEYLSVMLNNKPGTEVTQARDYRFNNEGNQMAYLYDVEVTKTVTYDATAVKNLARSLLTRADEVSSEIDAKMVNTSVDYRVILDINLDFEDAVTHYIAYRAEKEN